MVSVSELKALFTQCLPDWQLVAATGCSPTHPNSCTSNRETIPFFPFHLLHLRRRCTALSRRHYFCFLSHSQVCVIRVDLSVSKNVKAASLSGQTVPAARHVFSVGNGTFHGDIAMVPLILTLHTFNDNRTNEERRSSSPVMSSPISDGMTWWIYDRRCTSLWKKRVASDFSHQMYIKLPWKS